MIERQPSWYHYLMLPFSVQLLIVLASVILVGAQLIVYAIMSDPVTVFDGQCDVAVGGMDAEGNPVKGATMQCGGEPVDLGVLEAPYLYEVLTAKAAPAILCKKTETEYIGEVKWTCNMGTEE